MSQKTVINYVVTHAILRTFNQPWQDKMVKEHMAQTNGQTSIPSLADRVIGSFPTHRALQLLRNTGGRSGRPTSSDW